MAKATTRKSAKKRTDNKKNQRQVAKKVKPASRTLARTQVSKKKPKRAAAKKSAKTKATLRKPATARPAASTTATAVSLLGAWPFPVTGT